ncbi:hypothetical protein [Cohnella sp. JJ-181]|uniref:hypothetical protein n=1 Tax=Cohnella rhizoplanae TaxID=2974897 RepID=UPI0022FF7374|nr:hypothetical protein [Cohnella sp. JJ-181]CAI6068870.1 hypothetical protein COHCIP112018_02197 [Cohnella sp. JJ-181]
MAIFTSILNLLKKNPATDGADTFNIQTMLNDNWDKIDAAMALKGANGSVRAATASNTTLSGLQTVDGVSLAAGDRVLVKNQTTGSQNGIYVAAASAWVRAADADSSAKLATGILVYVREGTMNAGKGFVLSNAGVVTLGTTALTFSQASGTGAADDSVIGNRTVTDSVTPGISGTLTALLSSLFTLVKGITGKSSALTGPSITLEATKAHVDATTAHGAVPAPTASTMMARDSAGRAQVAAPSAAGDIARKDTVDAAIATAASDATSKANAVQSNLTAHIGTGGAAHTAATTNAAGFMSAADKIKLDDVATGAGGTNSATDTVIGNRTINDGIAQSAGSSGPLTTLFGQIGNMIKIITGKANWYSTPRTTLENAVKLNGDTMTGPLVLSSDPTVALGASTKQYVDALPYGMARQALINGNFDVWQRGTNLTGLPYSYFSDRWKNGGYNPDGGTMPSITVSRGVILGDIPGASYYFRIIPSGAGTSFGANSEYTIDQNIEFGTRYLCGMGKKVTVSFWARSSITSKKIGVIMYQAYGTGGSPSPLETLTGTSWTMSSGWTKYTFTFNTNSLVGKTFGSNNDDVLILRFYIAWGANLSVGVSAVGAETFRGSGTIDIAQVQLCSGDVALPFQPRTFADELELCQRYFEKSYNMGVAPGTAGGGAWLGAISKRTQSSGGNLIVPCVIPYRVKKRITAIPNVYSPSTGAANMWLIGGSNDVAVNYFNQGEGGFSMFVNRTWGSNETYEFQWTADAEL